MKKNGFTLIELLAAIGLLGMLATILITVSIRKINETKEKSRETLIESIELAAKNYAIDYGNELDSFNDNDYIYVKLQTLVEKEYFNNSLVDQTTGKSLPLSDEVYIKRETSGKINSSYDINQRNNPKLRLIGPYNVYINLNDEYQDLGVTAIDKDGNNVSSSVIIKSTVDTNSIGTYQVSYELGDIIIKRNIIVYK